MIKTSTATAADSATVLKPSQISNKPSPPSISSVIERQTLSGKQSSRSWARPPTFVSPRRSQLINGIAEASSFSPTSNAHVDSKACSQSESSLDNRQSKPSANARTKADYGSHSERLNGSFEKASGNTIDEVPAGTSSSSSTAPSSISDPLTTAAAGVPTAANEGSGTTAGAGAGGGASLMTFINAIPRRVNLVAAANAGSGAASLFTSWLSKRSSSVDAPNSRSPPRSTTSNRPLIDRSSEGPRTPELSYRPIGVPRRHIFTLQTRKGLTMNGCSAAASVDESTEATEESPPEQKKESVENRCSPRSRPPMLRECRFRSGKDWCFTFSHFSLALFATVAIPTVCSFTIRTTSIIAWCHPLLVL